MRAVRYLGFGSAARLNTHVRRRGSEDLFCCAVALVWSIWGLISLLTFAAAVQAALSITLMRVTVNWETSVTA